MMQATEEDEKLVALVARRCWEAVGHDEEMARKLMLGLAKQNPDLADALLRVCKDATAVLKHTKHSQ